MKVYILITTIICSSIIAHPQENKFLFESIIERDSVIWQWTKGEEVEGKVIDFWFPSYSSWQPSKEYSLLGSKNKKYIQASIALDNKKLFVLKDSSFNWETKGYPIIKAELYAKNIDTILVQIKLFPLNRWFVLESIRIKKGYLFQPESIFPIEEKDIRNIIKQNKDKLPTDTFFISEIKIQANVKNKDSKLIIGNIYYIDHFNDRKVFVNTLDNYYKINWNTNLDELKKNPGVFLEIPNMYERYETMPRVKLLIPDTLNDVEQVEYVGGYLHNVLTVYNRYDMNNLNKDSILNIHKRIIKSSKSLDHYYANMDTLFNYISDIHFDLINSIDPKYYYTNRQPLHFYKIGEEIQVVAVLDSTIHNINLGDRLTKINNEDINSFINRLGNRVIASSSHGRERKILQKLLMLALNEFKDSLILTFDNKNIGKYTIKLDSTQIYENKNLYIPKNFKIKPNKLFYEKIGDYAYLRIPSFWEKELIPFFSSYIDSLKTSSGLVIDLRNNFEGDLSFAYLLSFFIDELTPCVSFPLYYIEDEFAKTSSYETLIVKPSSLFYYDKPIVILMDERTTCASEIFIYTLLTKGRNVASISVGKTAGAAEVSRTTRLPETENFIGFIKYAYFKNEDNTLNEITKHRGLSPSIISYFESYNDLAPYNDKLLHIGLKYLENH